VGFLDSLKKMFAGSAGNARYYHDELGLAPDEDFKSIVVGSLWSEPSKATQTEAAVLGIVGIFTGHKVDIVGVQATIGVTTHGRLVVGMIQDHADERLSFPASEGYRLERTDRTSKDKVMGPSGRLERGIILSLVGQSGEVFQIIVGESKAEELAASFSGQ
jgi:hypothetical protein